MSEELVTIPVEVQMPLKTVQAIVRQYLLAQLTQQTNGTSPVTPPQEDAAPVLPSLDASPGQASAGAP